MFCRRSWLVLTQTGSLLWSSGFPKTPSFAVIKCSELFSSLRWPPLLFPPPTPLPRVQLARHCPVIGQAAVCCLLIGWWFCHLLNSHTSPGPNEWFGPDCAWWDYNCNLPQGGREGWGSIINCMYYWEQIWDALICF